eukprot:jgi/Psemu1/27360/gm1.27360_g
MAQHKIDSHAQNGRIMSSSVPNEHNEEKDNRRLKRSELFANRMRILSPRNPPSGRKTKKREKLSLYMSDFAIEIYFVLFLFLLIRRYWVLHGLQFLILFHIGDILFSWFLHVKDAREIRNFRSWLLWWARIGLDFATNTVEGAATHRMMVAYTLNFWNLIGKNYTINWFNDIADKGRTRTKNRVKERIEESQKNQQWFKKDFKQNLAKITGKTR